LKTVTQYRGVGGFGASIKEKGRGHLKRDHARFKGREHVEKGMPCAYKKEKRPSAGL